MEVSWHEYASLQVLILYTCHNKCACFMHSFFFIGYRFCCRSLNQSYLFFFCRLISFLERLICVDNWVVESVVKKLKQESSPCCSSSHSTFIKCFCPFKIACITWYLQHPQCSFDKLKVIGWHHRVVSEIQREKKVSMPVYFSGYCSRLPISRTYSNYHDQF